MQQEVAEEPHTGVTAEANSTSEVQQPSTIKTAAPAIPATVDVPQLPPVYLNHNPYRFANMQLPPQAMIPPVASNPIPILVNRRQYYRIEKRRESRRVLEAYYAKFPKMEGGSRPKHPSRMKHASSRPRNKRGQYMNGQELEDYYRENPEKRPRVEQQSATPEVSSGPSKPAPTLEIAKFGEIVSKFQIICWHPRLCVMKKNVVKSNDELALQEEGKVVATTTDANDADQKLPPDEEGKDEENCGGDNDEDEKIPISFDWPVYVDATLAGLSVLIPVPFVDNIMEIVFARRMIGAIAQRRKVELSAQRISMVNNRLTCCGMILACFYFPIFVILELVISLFRILVYCWTIKKSTDALTYYWQRAFLMDYMLQRGYVSTKDPDQAEAAIVCMERLLDEVAQSPLTRLARKIIYAPCRIGFSIMWYMCCCCCCCCCGGKNGGKDGSIGQAEATMSESWTNFGAYLTSLAERYEDEFAKSQRPRGNGMMIRRFCCP